MNVNPLLSKRAPERPAAADGAELLASMLRATGRGGVPIRRAFLQTPQSVNGSRAASLSKIVKSRDEGTLDAYLLIHAMASSSQPFEAWYPAWTWVRILGFDKTAGADAARTHWAKATSKLVKLGLIARKRNGNKMTYVLMHESGDGTPYQRPKKLTHGSWSTLPHEYWTQGFREELDLAAKAMLLVALDQPDGFELASERAPAWYGLSASTAKRGLKTLCTFGILDFETNWKLEPKAKDGWTEIRKYTTQGLWATSARALAMSRPDAQRRGVAFAPEPSDVTESKDGGDQTLGALEQKEEVDQT